MSLKYTALACLISAIISAAVTQFYFPKVVSKTVETTKEVTHNDVQTVIRTVSHPGGETESTTTITDHSQKVDTSKAVIQLNPVKDWMAGVSYSTSIHTLEPTYGIQIQRRVFGPVWAAGTVNLKGEIGIAALVEF